MALTDTRLRSLKPLEKKYKVSDRDGLFVIVQPNGSILWRWKYYQDGKPVIKSLGTYPEVSLAAARTKCTTLRQARRDGMNIDDILHSRQDATPTFEQITRAWLAKEAPGWSDHTLETITRRLETRIFPRLGNIPVTQLKAMDFVQPLKHVEDSGQFEIAHRVAADCCRALDYAVSSGVVENNVAARVGNILKPIPKKHYPCITDKTEIGILLRSIQGYKCSFTMSMCMKIMPYVFVRSRELRGACWQEIDFDSATWTIPAERMKMKKEHVVPLSRQVVDLFRELKDGVNSSLCFPSIKSRTQCISDVGLLSVLRNLGYERSRMCVHGFRSIASTILNEQGFREDVIEAQLAHTDGNKVRAAYNRAQYLDERRDMMQKYADCLDELKGRASAC